MANDQGLTCEMTSRYETGWPASVSTKILVEFGYFRVLDGVRCPVRTFPNIRIWHPTVQTRQSIPHAARVWCGIRIELTKPWTR